jgi:hypothetical protein
MVEQDEVLSVSRSIIEKIKIRLVSSSVMSLETCVDGFAGCFEKIPFMDLSPQVVRLMHSRLYMLPDDVIDIIQAFSRVRREVLKCNTNTDSEMAERKKKSSRIHRHDKMKETKRNRSSGKSTTRQKRK